MRYRVEIAARAEDDIRDTYLWLSERSHAAADRWRTGLRDAIASLAVHPALYPLAPEADAFTVEVRQLLYGRRAGKYRVLFAIIGDTVYVTHVRHGAREPLKPGGSGQEIDE